MALRERVRIGLLALITLAAAALSCSFSNDDRLIVRPLEAILASPISITDLTPTSAVVRVQTELDVVCSVVFGQDNSYGNQSTDTEMGGRGHTVHSAPLRGLAPDTTYHYRLQGTGADGTVYVSRDLTFRTPGADGSGAISGVNVAAVSRGAKVVDASSAFGGQAWRPENAIDGDPNTEWSSAGDGDGAYITVELSASYQLGAVGLWTRTMGSSAQIARFQVVTDDGTVLGPYDLPDSKQMHTFPVSVTAKTLRFEVVSSSGGNTGVVELAAYTTN